MAGPVGQTFHGEVKSWRAPWGWLAVPELGADVFAHQEEIVGGTPRRGGPCTFELGVDGKTGKYKATRIQIDDALYSGPEPAHAGTGVRVDGIIQSWMEPWGWISSPFHQNKNVFGHREDIVDAQLFGLIEVGMPVTFEIGVDAKTGKDRAMKIQFVGDFSPGPAATEPGERHHGVVATWREQWGWITSPEYAADGDLFAHSADVLAGARMSTGMPVTFEMGFDSKGRRRAQRISSAGSAPSRGVGGGGSASYPGVGGLPSGGAGGLGAFGHFGNLGDIGAFGGGSGFDGPGGSVACISRSCGAAAPPLRNPSQVAAAAAPAAAPRGFSLRHNPGFLGVLPPPPATASPATFVGQRLEGSVVSWKDQWGWVSSPLFQTDLFAHSEDLVGGRVPAGGSPVSFVVGTDKKGRLRALQIQSDGRGGAVRKRRMEPPPAGGALRPADFDPFIGVVLEGEVQSWKSPWGWLRCSEIAGEVFAHKEESLSGEEPSVGMRVSFTVGKDRKSGRARALQFSILGHGPDGSRKRQRLVY